MNNYDRFVADADTSDFVFINDTNNDIDVERVVNTKQEEDIVILDKNAKNYSPKQPRDSDGKWTKGSGLSTDYPNQKKIGEVEYESEAGLTPEKILEWKSSAFDYNKRMQYIAPDGDSYARFDYSEADRKEQKQWVNEHIQRTSDVDMAKDIGEYAGNKKYSAINHYLRDPEAMAKSKVLTERDKPFLKSLLSRVKNSTRADTVAKDFSSYRAASFQEDYISNIKPGSFLDDKGIVSTSMDAVYASDFGARRARKDNSNLLDEDANPYGNAIFRFNFKEGQKGVWSDPYRKGGGIEHEWIPQHGSVYQVKSNTILSDSKNDKYVGALIDIDVYQGGLPKGYVQTEMQLNKISIDKNAIDSMSEAERFVWLPNDITVWVPKKDSPDINYSPKQARDDSGRWTKGGSSTYNPYDGLIDIKSLGIEVMEVSGNPYILNDKTNVLYENRWSYVLFNKTEPTRVYAPEDTPRLSDKNTENVIKSFTDNEKKAITDYTSEYGYGSYSNVNDYLRNGDNAKQVSKETIESAKNITSALNKSTLGTDTYVFRGAEANMFKDEKIQKAIVFANRIKDKGLKKTQKLEKIEILNSLKGKIIKDKAPLSTSLYGGPFLSNRDVKITIKTKKSDKALNISALSKFGGASEVPAFMGTALPESELLYAPNTSFEIKDVKMTSYGVNILMESTNKTGEIANNKIDNYSPKQPRDGSGRWSSVGGHKIAKTKSEKELGSFLQTISDMASTNRAKDLKYNSSEDMVQKLGTYYTPKERPEGVPLGPSKQCFKNAFDLSMRNEDYTYVEGYATSSNIPIALAHAWVIDKNENVIDNTWQPAGSAYKGIPFNSEFATKEMLDKGEYGLVSGASMNKYLEKGLPDNAIAKKEKDTNEAEKVVNTKQEEDNNLLLQQSTLENQIINIQSQVAGVVLNNVQVVKNAYDQQGEIITDEQKSEYEKELNLALIGFMSVVIPVIAVSIMNKRAKQTSLVGTFKLDSITKQYINEIASKASQGHIETILNDLLTTIKNTYDFEVDKKLQSVLIDGGKITDADLAADIGKAYRRKATDADLVKAREMAMSGDSQQQIVRAIKNEYSDHITTARAKAIARTETNRAFTQSQFQADRQFLEQNDLTKKAYKKWVTTNDNPCEICKELASQPPIPFEKNFASIGDELSVTFETNGKTKVQKLMVEFEDLTAGNAHVNCGCKYELVLK